MKKCKKCNETLEMYYEEYCPKCDIQKKIYLKTIRPLVYFPIKKYGLKYVEDFTDEIEEKLWENICNILRGNDSYIDYYLSDEREEDKAFMKVLDALNVKYEINKTINLWISW